MGAGGVGVGVGARCDISCFGAALSHSARAGGYRASPVQSHSAAQIITPAATRAGSQARSGRIGVAAAAAATRYSRSRRAEARYRHFDLNQLSQEIFGVSQPGFRRVDAAVEFRGDLPVGETDTGQHLFARETEDDEASVGIGQEVDGFQHLGDLRRAATVKVVDEDRQFAPAERVRDLLQSLLESRAEAELDAEILPAHRARRGGHHASGVEAGRG